MSIENTLKRHTVVTVHRSCCGKAEKVYLTPCADDVLAAAMAREADTPCRECRDRQRPPSTRAQAQADRSRWE